MALVSKEQRTQSDTNERYNKKNAFLLVMKYFVHGRILLSCRHKNRGQYDVWIKMYLICNTFYTCATIIPHMRTMRELFLISPLSMKSFL